MNEQNSPVMKNPADQSKEKTPQEQSPLQTKKGFPLFCRHCGTKLRSKDQKFCEHCGSRIELSEETQAAKTQNIVRQNVTTEKKEQGQPVKKKSFPKIAVILPVCIAVIGILVFAALNLRDSAASGDSPSDTGSSQPTPFTEYLALVGGDYKELYSDEYNIAQIGANQYMAATDISFMDIAGKGSFQFYHAEEEEEQSTLDESRIEQDTVLDFRWACDASVYSLDDVSAGFESVYGAPPMHGTYSFGNEDNEYQVESYCWENVEGGYDLELSLASDASAINASWSVSPDTEGSYEDVISTLTKAFEERDVSAYERLLYEDDEDLSASNSTKEEMAEIISNEEIDQIDSYAGGAVKVTSYFDRYMMSGNYSQTFGYLGRIESLYLADMDLVLYQNENIIAGASCKIDIAYIDGEWKILGIFRNERFSDTLLTEFAKQYYEAANGNVPPNVEVDHYEGGLAVLHLYEADGNAASTWDWYTIDPYTLEGTDFLGNEIRLYEIFDGEGP